MSYDQRKEDPASFYLSLAVIAALVGIGSVWAGGGFLVVAAVSFFAAWLFWGMSRRS